MDTIAGLMDRVSDKLSDYMDVGLTGVAIVLLVPALAVGMIVLGPFWLIGKGAIGVKGWWESRQ